MNNEPAYLFHVTMVTHNSRTSERMKKLRIKVGTPVVLSEREEMDLVIKFSKVVRKNKYKILNFNICKDHVHFVIYCSAENLERIVCNLKTVTSKEFKKVKSVNLWAQKFNRKVIETDEQLGNVMEYIKHNRIKHNLPENQKLQRLIEKMLTPYEKLIMDKGQLT